MSKTAVSKNDLNERIAALEALAVKLSVSGGDKKPRAVTEKGILAKAKMIYYHANKNSKAVQDMLKKKHNISGDEVMKPTFKEWRKVKACTDELFAKLSSSEVDKLKKQAETAKLPKNDEGVEL